MKLRVLTILILVSGLSYVYSGDDKLYVIGADSNTTTAVALRIKADYVAVPVRIVDDSKVKEADRKVHFQRKTAKALVAGAIKSKTSFDVRLTGLNKQPYVYLLLPLDSDGKDTAYYSDKVETLFKPIFFSGKSDCHLDAPVLAMNDPERFRNQIIKKIIESVESLAASLGSTIRVTISGLEQPVVVKQYDDEYVDLYIPYTLSIEMMRGGKARQSTP